MARKSTIGTNPLDALIPGGAATKAPKREAVKEDAPSKQRITILIGEELASKARDACYWTPGLTLAALLEDALSREIARLEKSRGEAFPPRSGKIRTGRPMKR